MRVGTGYDVHRLVEGRPLIIGGVKIAHHMGLFGHSDADVLCHAIIDALLGAAGLADIGSQFPDNDPAYAGISSLLLLEHSADLLADALFFIENIDATIIAEAPKMSPYIYDMRKAIAAALGIMTEQVNVKASSEEGLGFTGSGAGIAAQAICLLSTPVNVSAAVNDVLAPEDLVCPRGTGCGGCPKRA